MTTLRGLIFDADGTLVETEEFHRRAFNDAFAAYGLSWNWSKSEYSRLLLMSGGLERMRTYAAESSCPLPVAADATDDEWLQRIHKYKSRLYRRYISTQPIEPRPGVSRILREAKDAGVALAVATSSCRRNMDVMLVRSGLRHFFKLVISSDDVPSKKPSPAVYLRALAELKLPAQNCVAFEDTQAGCTAALGADLAVLVTTHCFTERHKFAGARMVADCLGDADRHCKVIAGEHPAKGYVDLETLRQLIVLT